MKRLAAYERDPYLQQLQTEIIRTGEEKGRHFAILRDTLFYPEGGGQPGDRGLLNDKIVTDVRQVEGAIRHYLESPVDQGPAHLVLDWPRRLDHMQQHTAQHLLTAIAEDRFSWATTAFHLGDQVSDIELDVQEADPDAVGALEEAVVAQICAARKVTVSRVTEEKFAALKVRTRGLPSGHQGPIRLVEIEGIDLNTCGGTHVRLTSEIETIKLLGTESMRGGTRLYFLAGGRVRRRLAEHEARTAELRHALGAADRELASVLKSRLDQIHDLQHRERILREELVEAAAEALASRSDDLIEAHFRAGDPAFLQSLAHRVQSMAEHKAALLTAGSETEGFFAVVAGDRVVCDVQALGRQVAILLNGRGGGSGRTYHGKAASLAKRKDALALFELELERD